MTAIIQALFGCWHRWGQWQDTKIMWVDRGHSISAQKRYCEHCGKKQMRRLNGSAL
jgi:hypothetical protein